MKDFKRAVAIILAILLHGFADFHLAVSAAAQRTVGRLINYVERTR